MSLSKREEILRQAMSLPPEDRIYVANALVRSLPSETSFMMELHRRSAAYRAGTTTARLASEVLSDLKGRQAKGSAPKSEES